MKSTWQYTITIFQFVLLCLADHEGGPDPEEVGGVKTYHNGDWPFLMCTQDQGEALINIWATVGHYLDTLVVPDARNNAQNSENGFNIMFSTNSGSDVASVLEDASAHKFQSTLNPGKQIGNILVLCANRGITTNPVISSAIDRAALYCDQGYLFVTQPNVDIYVCPRFFSIAKDFATSQDCPPATSNKFLTPVGTNADQPAIGQNKMQTIVYQLSRKYAPHTVAPNAKIWALNGCAAAAANIQLNNGNNYAFYAGFLVAGCTTFPTRKPSGKHRRQLPPGPASASEFVQLPTSSSVQISATAVPASNSTDDAGDEVDLTPAQLMQFDGDVDDSEFAQAAQAAHASYLTLVGSGEGGSNTDTA